MGGVAERDASWLLLAAACFAAVLHTAGGFFSALGLVFIAGAVGCACFWGMRWRMPFSATWFLVPWLAVEATGLGRWPNLPDELQGPATAAIAAVVAALTPLLWFMVRQKGDDTAKYAYRAIFLLGFLVAGVFVVEHEAPVIDVYDYQTEAATRILNGEPLNGASYLRPGSTSSEYPYMPLEALLRAPFYLLGDIRYAGVAAILATYPLLVVLARRHGPRGVDPDLVASCIVLAGAPLYIVRHAWTEPLILPFLAGALVLLEKRPLVAYVLLGLAAALKLWLLVLIPAAWSINRTGGIVSAVSAAMTALPFAVQDFAGLLNGTLLFHLRLPARFDGNTLSHLWRGWPVVVGAVAWLAAAFWLAVSRRQTAGVALLVVAGALLALFFLGKQGNPNYYWLLAPLLGFAGLALRLPAPVPAAESATGVRPVVGGSVLPKIPPIDLSRHGEG